MRHWILPAGCLVFAALAACSREPAADVEEAPAVEIADAETTETPAPNESDDSPRIAEGVDEETLRWAETAIAANQPRAGHLFGDKYRWGPTRCEAPNYKNPPPSKADTGGHARKLYLLWVRERVPYVELTEQPVGQTIRKLTWYPAEGAPLDERKPGERGPTFIMHKLDPATEGTDAGWIYATFTPEGELTAAGQLENCMGCHQNETTDRMFGLPAD